MQDSSVQIDPETGYFTNIEDVRTSQYPNLANTTYLDHAGTTPYARTLIEAFSHDLTQNLYGNPHSASASSQLSSRRIEDTRLQVLRFFDARPDDFDVVFVANATAAIKLVADAFRDHAAGFWYGYHLDSHTSLVGVRELAARGSRCFENDAALDSWLLAQGSVVTDVGLTLLAYPGQSNMTGRRLTADWPSRISCIRRQSGRQIYTLLDAAALASTSPLNFSDSAAAPDFTAVSFYKIFGFPDLGALLVRRDSGDIWRRRCYFGGGTVDTVGVLGDTWHAKKAALSSRLEDGTLPFHSILALQAALKTHSALYGSMHNISRHAGFLASRLDTDLRNLQHANGKPTCELYSSPALKGRGSENGPVLSFNLLDRQGNYISTTEVEKLAIVNGIQFRTGGLCNPGGVASYLKLTKDDLRQNYAAGHRCGNENDIVNGKPTGMIRVSLGAMSSLKDVHTLIQFLKEYYIDSFVATNSQTTVPELVLRSEPSKFVVESLSVFPIKSCAAFKIPPDVSWKVGLRGLAWDREWCLVHEGTHVALSQKRYPRMALLFPSINVEANALEVTHNIHGSGGTCLKVSLLEPSVNPNSVRTCDAVASRTSNVCGETVEVEHYTSMEVSNFFTDALGVPCTLARFPKTGTIRWGQVRAPEAQLKDSIPRKAKAIHLSNESPILLISRSSVNRLNEQIKQRGGVGEAVSADSFRGNIVISEELKIGQQECAHAEDGWKQLRIGDNKACVFEVLGPCQRCQMVCVDQEDASRRREPFSTLSKTRKRDGRVWFGMHLSLVGTEGATVNLMRELRIGDRVVAS